MRHATKESKTNHQQVLTGQKHNMMLLMHLWRVFLVLVYDDVSGHSHHPYYLPLHPTGEIVCVRVRVRVNVLGRVHATLTVPSVGVVSSICIFFRRPLSIHSTPSCLTFLPIVPLLSMLATRHAATNRLPESFP